VKEPDFTFFPHKPEGLRGDFPSVVLEFSWTSSEPEAVDYRRLWHEGSGGQVRVVIFVKLCRANEQNKICATLEISHCTPGTGAVATTTKIVYLLPPLPPTISESQTPFYSHNNIGSVSSSQPYATRPYYYDGRVIFRGLSTRSQSRDGTCPEG